MKTLSLWLCERTCYFLLQNINLRSSCVRMVCSVKMTVTSDFVSAWFHSADCHWFLLRTWWRLEIYLLSLELLIFHITELVWVYIRQSRVLAIRICLTLQHSHTYINRQSDEALLYLNLCLTKVPYGGLSDFERTYYGLIEMHFTGISTSRQTLIRRPLHFSDKECIPLTQIVIKSPTVISSPQPHKLSDWEVALPWHCAVDGPVWLEWLVVAGHWHADYGVRSWQDEQLRHLSFVWEWRYCGTQTFNSIFLEAPIFFVELTEFHSMLCHQTWASVHLH